MNPIFYFLLALTAVLASTANAGGPVLDVNGNFIFSGSYYVLPVIFGAAGGGLTLAPRGDKPCPLYVVQDTLEVNKGIPVRFLNWRSRVGFVPESENLNIEMDVKATVCAQSAYWWVVPSDRDTRTWVIAAGRKPEAEEKSSRSFFQIKKSGGFPNGYNIVFCPSGNDCMNVGVSVDENGVRRLALSSRPFPVVFAKATKPKTPSKTMSII
ncbi:unnamed protein product [Thlaspi arvense]|uniref:Uncharacterized protein n=1 Tax=Thlaspi arvense TaxID=13288 RepID=A0AAU9SFV0_THLAR|nr:unnamed protein product [Thlaspi arvense]